MKRVLLLVVDGCTPRVLGPALQSGELPVLAELAARGTLQLDCVSVFPSITPAATASIITGRYPAGHGIAGMSWWDAATDNVMYLGDDVWTVWERGFDAYLRGFLLRLNGDRLRAPTLLQRVERQGRRAACFNFLIFRGDVAHEISPPLLLRLLPSVSGRLTVHGPSWLCLGDFVATAGRRQVDAPGGPLNRFGLDDEGTAAFLRDLPGAGELPDFTVAYFPDYDFDSHERGPDPALETLRRLDRHLAAIVEAWGGLDRVLDEACLVLTADHSHSDVGDDPDAAIALDELLAGHRRGDPAAGWKDDDELLLCPNMRSAEIYLRQDDAGMRRRICREVLEDRRVDQVIWRERDDASGDTWHVATRDRGSLAIRRAGDGGAAARDAYGGAWDLRGEVGAVGATIENGRIEYGAYPNACERVANGLEASPTGRLWVTATPGCEFQVPGQQVHHAGGSHGTLHELDSLVPLLVAGSPQPPAWRATPRIVDVAPLCAAFLDLPFDTPPGAPHG